MFTIFFRYVLALALKDLGAIHTNTSKPPSDCSKSGSDWEDGKKLFEYEKFSFLIINFKFINFIKVTRNLNNRCQMHKK